MICVDTSFLISFYGDDEKSVEARRHRAASTHPLRVHALNDFELANALRALVFRGKITAIQRRDWLADYEADKKAGILRFTEMDANEMLRFAEVLSATWTESQGNRCLDILHLAAAKALRATEFWSFDARQRDLATAAGLRVGP